MLTHIFAWRNTESLANKEGLITGGAEDSEKTLTLTAEGMQKVAQLAQKVTQVCQLSKIYSSDLKRAYIVAEAVQGFFGTRSSNSGPI